MNEILDHWSFLEPDNYSDILQKNEELPKDWIKIFYIARCLFSSNSSFPIKGHLAPLLERKKIFQKATIQKDISDNGSVIKSNMDESIDIGRITSIHQISHILPREFIINVENIFYKKLLNRELNKKEFETPEGFSVSDLVNGKERELNRKQKVYILFDSSYSMNGEKFSKIFAAKAICLEYLRKVRKENPQIYFRYFHQTTGPLLKVRKPRQFKDLIRYINNLNTFECYETKIDNAILTAVEDIKSDPECNQAEILMITDGLGDLPTDIEKQLGDIKFHCILISGLDIGRFLDLYPDQASWEKANLGPGSKDMPSYYETFLKIKQVYRLQEVTNIFVRIPSSYLEKFNFSNTHELELIGKARADLAHQLKSELSNREKYEIFQKLKFIIQYLKIMLSKEPSPELKQKIKNEINAYQILVKKILKNKWFAFTLDNQAKLTRKRINEPMLFISGKSKKQWIVIAALGFILKNLAAIPRHTITGFCYMANNTNTWLSDTSRKHKLRKRFDHINSMLFRILAE